MVSRRSACTHVHLIRHVLVHVAGPYPPTPPEPCNQISINTLTPSDYNLDNTITPQGPGSWGNLRCVLQKVYETQLVQKGAEKGWQTKLKDNYPRYSTYFETTLAELRGAKGLR